MIVCSNTKQYKGFLGKKLEKEAIRRKPLPWEQELNDNLSEAF